MGSCGTCGFDTTARTQLHISPSNNCSLLYHVEPHVYFNMMRLSPGAIIRDYHKHSNPHFCCTSPTLGNKQHVPQPAALFKQTVKPTVMQTAFGLVQQLVGCVAMYTVGKELQRSCLLQGC